MSNEQEVIVPGTELDELAELSETGLLLLSQLQEIRQRIEAMAKKMQEILSQLPKGS